VAAIQARNGTYRILFRYEGKQYTYPVGQVSELDAKLALTKVENWLGRIKARLVTPPPADRILEFIQHDGVLPDRCQAPVKAALTLAALRDDYLQLHTSVLDPRTVADMRGHWKHLARLLGGNTQAETLGLSTLQKYVMDRVGEGVEAATAQKEIVTLRTCWNWGARMSLLTGAFPNKGLRYPKGKEKPPFMTAAEVRKRIAAGESGDLWESVFLTRPEIDGLLETVKAQSAYPWVYPMFCFCAHTGARRSEMLRARVTDIDLEAGTALIREKKRRRSVKESTRRVPLSPFLRDALKDWLAVHPGGTFLFCHSGVVGRSKKRSRTTGHKGDKTRASTKSGRLATVQERETPAESALTRTEASDHFNRTLAGTEWENLTGWHALRHSFVSNCAAAGVDQRLIDAWAGHTTEDMRRRYRHLIPSVEQQAIKQVFGAGRPAETVATLHGR
jgi:integrase